MDIVPAVHDRDGTGDARRTVSSELFAWDSLPRTVGMVGQSNLANNSQNRWAWSAAQVPVALREAWRHANGEHVGNNGPRQPRMRYPARFKIFVAVVLGLSLFWFVNYLLAVLPTIEAHVGAECRYNYNQISYNAKMLFLYFAWFAITRVALFMPCVSSRVVAVESRTNGRCHTSCVHLVLRDGSLYIFAIGSLLFWVHLTQTPDCEERDPELYQTLKMYAVFSCLMGSFCLVLTYWHNRLLMDAAQDFCEPLERGAPADTIVMLQTQVYDEALFGDEDTKTYPAECAICLAMWEPEDSIKITPCKHAFHFECLHRWLLTARTCALCRLDLTFAVRDVRTASDAARRGDTSRFSAARVSAQPEAVGVTQVEDL